MLFVEDVIFFVAQVNTEKTVLAALEVKAKRTVTTVIEVH